MKLFDEINRLNEKYIEFWQKVAELESPTEDKEGVDACAKAFAEKAESIGFKTEKFDVKESGDIVTITLNPDSPERPITLSGHIDTVHPKGSFGTPAARIEDGKLYGPGVMDCKGGAVAALMAMEALSACGYNRRPIMLILQTDEECNSRQSGKKTINHILEKAKNSVAFLNCESSRRGTLVLERKGVIRYKFTVIGKEIHSSRCAEGTSAICEAAHKIIELEKFKDEKGLTCSCGMISGGVAENTVPAECVFTADIRFSTDKELEFIRKKVFDVANTSTVPQSFCRVEEAGFRPAMELCDRNLEFFSKINAIFEKNGLEKMIYRKSLGASDAADVTMAGIPCVDSIGVEGDHIHSVREYALISSLASAAKRLACIIWDFD